MDPNRSERTYFFVVIYTAENKHLKHQRSHGLTPLVDQNVDCFHTLSLIESPSMAFSIVTCMSRIQ